MLFSIIIPAYNAEKYLDKCLQSILSQGGRDYELIVIDDGSSDRTWELLCGYAQNYSELKLIQKPNGGIGSAVKAGLKKAEGDYIVFVDSDDYVAPDMLQTLQNTILKTSCDVVQYGLVMVDQDGNILKKEVPDLEQICGTDKILDTHFKKYPSPSLASRCFRRRLFENITILEQSIGFDETVILQLLAQCRSMESIKKELYYVYVRPGSISRVTYTEKQIEAYLKAYHFMNLYMKQHVPAFANEVSLKYLKLLIEILSEISKKKDMRKTSIYGKLKKEQRKIYNVVRESSVYRRENIKFRIGAGLCLLNPVCYRLIKNLIDRK